MSQNLGSKIIRNKISAATEPTGHLQQVLEHLTTCSKFNKGLYTTQPFLLSPLWDFLHHMKYNLGQNIWGLFQVLAQFPRTKSGTELDYSHQGEYKSCSMSCRATLRYRHANYMITNIWSLPHTQQTLTKDNKKKPITITKYLHSLLF